jgi:hypothetical protein
VGPGGVPTSRNFNNLVCPTALKGPSRPKGQFPKLSNRVAGVLQNDFPNHRLIQFRP